ncbi:MAG: VTT domain-containing protein [Candidatus Gracilibacteria bacterium]|nr:VTT domain-containing protein [Candidatus Gracilibacteria bacterium]
MLDYALHFYNNYTVIFYILLIITVILEGPITILTLSLLSTTFGFSFIFVYIFAIIGELFGDILHYILGRFFKQNIFKNKNFEILERTEEKLKNHSLFDKLIVIKYTPPITSIGLIYLGYNKVDFKKFLKNIVIFSFLNGFLITFIGFYFGKYFVNKDDFKYLIIGLLFSFLLLYFLIKIISSYFIKKVLNDK